MQKVVLKNESTDGEPLEATFLPEAGMNLCSYKKGDIEVIDASTQPLFDERFAGLGALIGPHFHHRRTQTLPAIKDESLFPHIARVRAKGVDDPFSHGIARYAPWTVENDEQQLTATLTGKDEWNGVPLAELQGQNFRMQFKAALEPDGLNLELSVVSDYDSLVGIHYYYALPQGKGTVTADIQPRYRDGDVLKELPENWNLDDQNRLTFDLSADADYGFHPYKSPLGSTIVLDTGKYQLHTTYDCTNQENTWQLYHPKDASFVCIEPMSAHDPRRPLLTVSGLNIKLSIVQKSSS